jgi:hypothetical protein
LPKLIGALKSEASTVFSAAEKAKTIAEALK